MQKLFNVALKLTTVKMARWLLSDERKTSLVSIKNAAMHEKRTIAQNNESLSFKSTRTLNRAVFPGKFNVFKLNRLLTSSCTLIRMRVTDYFSLPWLFGTGNFPQVVGVKHTTVKILKWRQEILFSGHAVQGRGHTGELCHVH